AAQRPDGRRGDRHHRPAVPARGHCVAGRPGAVVAAGHPGSRVRGPADRPAVLPGRQPLRPGLRLLPARAVDRVRRAVCLDRGRAGPGGHPAAAGRRVRPALHAEWTKLRTAPGTGWLLLAAVASTVTASALATATVGCPAGGCTVDTTRAALAGVQVGQ